MGLQTFFRLTILEITCARFCLVMARTKLVYRDVISRSGKRVPLHLNYTNPYGIRTVNHGSRSVNSSSHSARSGPRVIYAGGRTFLKKVSRKRSGLEYPAWTRGRNHFQSPKSQSSGHYRRLRRVVPVVIGSSSANSFYPRRSLSSAGSSSYYDKVYKLPIDKRIQLKKKRGRKVSELDYYAIWDQQRNNSTK